MEKRISGYAELADWIRRQIRENKFVPGQKMPSENQLHDRFGLSRQTIRRALEILEKEGAIYKVRGSGTYLRDAQNADISEKMRIAVVTTYVDGYIFPRTIQGMEEVLLEAGYSVQIAFTNNQNEKERLILEDIIKRDEVSGIIMETTKSGLPNPNLHLFEKLQKRRVPILFINSFYPELDIPHISLNDFMAGHKITSHMISMGHKKIGGIFKLDDGQGKQRYAGYMKAMLEAGLKVEDHRILWVDTEDMKDLSRLKEKILMRFQGCSGIFCYNDEVAFEMFEILKNAGIRVPEDISIGSVDDSELAVLGEVSLSSIPHPMEELGKKASQNLLRLIWEPSFDANYEFETEIVQRDSIRRIV